MKTYRRASLLLSTSSTVLFLCGLPSALAQQASESAGNTSVLPQIVVEDERTGETEASVGYVAKSTGTGSKSNIPIQEIPQSVSIVSRQEMDDQGAQSTDEALRYTAGVFAQPYGPDSDTNWFFLRGFNATQTGVFMDGLQLYSYGFGAFYVDSFNIERIDVLRGPASVLYGGSSPGGIVNYVSKKPTGERLRYTEAGINDAGTGYFGFDIGDSVTDTVDYRVSGRVLGGTGYFDFQEGFRGTVSPSVTWTPNDATSLTLLSNYTYIDEIHGAASFLPYVGTVERASFGRIDRDANYTEPDLDEYLRNQVSVGYEFEHAFDNNWTVRQNARYGYADVHEFNLYPYGYSSFSATPLLPDPVLSRIVFEHDTEINSVLLDTQLDGTVQTGAVDHDLLFGVDYKYFHLDQVQASATGTTISVTDPQYGAAQPATNSYINQTFLQHQLGAYVQDQLRFGGNWIVTLNGRHDTVWTEVHDGPTYWSPDQDTRNDSFDTALSGRAGLAYEFNNGLTPYASIATFFNPQIGTDRFGKMFEPETGTQYEVGVKYSPTFIDALFTVSLFDLTRQNVLTDDPVNPNFDTQTGEVRSRGIEFEAKANIAKNLMATAAFTAMDLEITEDTDTAIVGNTPNIVPEIQGSLWVEYGFDEAMFGGALDGVTVGGGVRYIGESWVDNENTMKVPDATLFDAKVGYEKDNWGVDLNVTNIADTRYVASCSSQYACSYGEGRSFKLRAYATW